MKRIVASLLLLSSVATAEIPNHHFQFGIGPSYISGLNVNNDVSFSWRAGYGWQMPNNFEMAVMADWGIAGNNQDTDMRYFTANLSGDYNFNDEDTTPFVTADIGYADVHAQWECDDPQCQSPDDSAAGLTMGVGGGYKFFRNSYAQLGVLARYSYVFARTRRGTPMKTSLQLVLDF